MASTSQSVASSMPNFPINRQQFVARMNERWRELDNQGNAALEETWAQMCDVFNQRILDFASPAATIWHTLSPGAGTGKTQGIAVYCQLLAENVTVQHPGVLFVTRLQQEADDFAELVNKLCGSYAAESVHSDKKNLHPDELRQVPVLVTTHSGYLLALRNAGYGNTKRWLTLVAHNNDHGTRQLTVIDEAINFIENHKITCESLEDLNRVFTKEIRSAVAQEKNISMNGQVVDACEYIDILYQQLDELVITESETVWVKPTKIIAEGQPFVRPLSLLRNLVLKLPFDQLLAEEKSQSVRKRLRKKYKKLIESVESLFTANAVRLVRRGSKNILVASEVLIPGNSHGCVVLDATSSIDALTYLNSRVRKYERIPGTRNYSRVTLYESRNHRLGKEYWIENGKDLAPLVIAEIDDRFQIGRKVLIVCHRQVKHHFKNFQTQCEYKVATWGKVAGRNDWQSFDTVFILGLPYRDRADEEGVFLSLQGDDEARWGVDPDTSVDDWKADVMSTLRLGPITADMIQAINRVRCRRVIDAEGRCADTAIYVLLPGGRDADYIVNTIHDEMPGIQRMKWEFGGAKRTVQRETAEHLLLNYADAMPVGEMPAKKVWEAADISESSGKQLVRRHLNDTTSQLRKALAAKGVNFQRHKNGRLYFVKN